MHAPIVPNSPCSSFWNSRNSFGKTALVAGSIIEVGLLIATGFVIDSNPNDGWTIAQMLGADLMAAALAAYCVHKGQKGEGIVNNDTSDFNVMAPVMPN